MQGKSSLLFTCCCWLEAISIAAPVAETSAVVHDCCYWWGQSLLLLLRNCSQCWKENLPLLLTAEDERHWLLLEGGASTAAVRRSYCWTERSCWSAAHSAASLTEKRILLPVHGGTRAADEAGHVARSYWNLLLMASLKLTLLKPARLLWGEALLFLPPVTTFTFAALFVAQSKW